MASPPRTPRHHPRAPRSEPSRRRHKNRIASRLRAPVGGFPLPIGKFCLDTWVRETSCTNVQYFGHGMGLSRESHEGLVRPPRARAGEREERRGLQKKSALPPPPCHTNSNTFMFMFVSMSMFNNNKTLSLPSV